MEKDTRAPTTRDSDKYIVRMPEGMRDRIAAAAKLNNRTMNAEIVARLQQSFDGGGSAAEAYEKLAIAGFVMKLLQNLIPDEVIRSDVGTMLKYLNADKDQEDHIAAISAFIRMQGDGDKNTPSPKK